MAQDITDQTFEQEVMNYEGVALVDFWAPWCGPCQIQGPILEELSKEVENKAKITKLNVDENPETAQKFGIMSIPTLILFKEGKEVEKVMGVQNKKTLLEKIDQQI